MAQKPNILFLMSDEHSPHAIGCEGNPIVQTPNLDQLAASGTYFESAYCQVPLCTPSRMCMLTGKHAHRCSAWNNGSILFPEHLTMPAHFAQHGYATALVGKMHFGGKEQHNGFQSRPYGDLRGNAGHQTDPLNPPSRIRGRTRLAGVTEIPSSLLQERVINGETLEYLRSQPEDQPWFLLASYSRPHFPLTAPKRLLDKYWPDNVDMPNIPPGHLEQTHRFAKGLRDNFNTQDIPPEETRKARAAYYACCEFLDETLGDLLTLLERDGFLDNTIIVYTTDHGEMAGEHGQWWKSSYYEAAARVPLIVWDKQIQQSHGARVTAPVELNDLFPTLCTRAGIPIPEDLDGADLTNLMSGDTDDWRNTAITEYWAPQTTGPMRMLRTPRYKYVAFPEDESILFDLETDPDEFESLSGQEEHKELEASLHEQLMDGFSWESVAEQMAADKVRSQDFKAPWGSGTPNQYTLPDGRIVDAETCLYSPSLRDEG
ncbi:sulfatase-like hydrolase/transferase [Candidatus Poribacteria bacterium]|nr:sulfatase-like hydrolase/transferase [Candidatus Poribacteria bacterium]